MAENKNVNTTKSIQKPQTNNADLKKQIKKAAAVFEKEEMVEKSIPKQFQKHIGPSLPLGINGVRIVLPVDGTKHKIPKSFANLLDEYLNNLTT